MVSNSDLKVVDALKSLSFGQYKIGYLIEFRNLLIFLEYAFFFVGLFGCSEFFFFSFSWFSLEL